MRFYTGVLGWTVTEVPFPQGSYTTLAPAGGGRDEAFGGMVPVDAGGPGSGPDPYWLPYLQVTDVDDVVARAVGAGGSVRTPPAGIPDVGRIAELADPYGARFALLAPEPR